MNRYTGPWNKARPQPWPEQKMIFALGSIDAQGRHQEERATLAKCIRDMPITPSTDYIMGEEGTVYADKLVESIDTLARATNAWDRKWAQKNVTALIGTIAASDCNQDPLCRQTEWRWVNYLVNPENGGNPAYVDMLMEPVRIALTSVQIRCGMGVILCQWDPSGPANRKEEKKWGKERWRNFWAFCESFGFLELHHR